MEPFSAKVAPDDDMDIPSNSDPFWSTQTGFQQPLVRDIPNQFELRSALQNKKETWSSKRPEPLSEPTAAPEISNSVFGDHTPAGKPSKVAPSPVQQQHSGLVMGSAHGGISFDDILRNRTDNTIEPLVDSMERPDPILNVTVTAATPVPAPPTKLPQKKSQKSSSMEAKSEKHFPIPQAPPSAVDYQQEEGFYEGERKNGLYHGQGTLETKQGGRYVGQWKEGKKHGRGIYSYPDGSIYSGLWSNDLPHGDGRFTWRDGEYYDGNYVKGKREGYGTMQYKAGDKFGDRYEGFWHNGFKEGRGRMTYGQVQTSDILAKSPFDRYVGEFKRGLRHGKGAYTFKDGSRFEGEYYEGKRHGMGIFIFKAKETKAAKKGEEKSVPRPAYISEWEYGEEKEDEGIHTKILIAKGP